MSAWPIPKLFAGQTVAVIAGGPSATSSAIASVRQYPRIAVRNSYPRAMDAAALVSLDGPAAWFDQARADGFRGLMLSGVPDCEHYIGLGYERFRVDANTEKEIRNSGLTAIRVAAQMGATRILLVGFDPETSGYAAGYAPGVQQSGKPYGDMAVALAAIVAELAAQGVTVERVNAAVQSRPEPVPFVVEQPAPAEVEEPPRRRRARSIEAPAEDGEQPADEQQAQPGC